MLFRSDENGVSYPSATGTLEITVIDQPKSGTIIILFVILLAVGGSSVAYYLSNKPHKKSIKPKSNKKHYEKVIQNIRKPDKKSLMHKLFG